MREHTNLLATFGDLQAIICESTTVADTREALEAELARLALWLGLGEVRHGAA